MKINLNKLQEVSILLSDQNLPSDITVDNSLTRDALKIMVTNVLNFSDAPFNLAPNNIKTAINTLVELKILILDNNEKPPVQQLNS